MATVYESMTVSAMIPNYAPAEDKNDPDKYTQVICGWSEIDLNALIRDLEPVKFLIYAKG